jgi:hypothetical protein
VEGVGVGLATNTPVTINYYPYYLFADGQKRNVTLVIYKDNVVIKDYPILIDEAAITALQTQEREDANISYQNTLVTSLVDENGQYVVVAFDADMDVLYTYTFTIEGVKSSRGTVVAMILGGVLLIMIFVFIRIRSKMRVK